MTLSHRAENAVLGEKPVPALPVLKFHIHWNEM